MNNADFFVEPVRETPIINDVDVLVCGGGFAGVAAAVAAARNGASVMLVERYGFLGGLATGALVITTPPPAGRIGVTTTQVSATRTTPAARNSSSVPAAASSASTPRPVQI